MLPGYIFILPDASLKEDFIHILQTALRLLFFTLQHHELSLKLLAVKSYLLLLLKKNLIEINGKSGVGTERSQDGIHDVLFRNMLIRTFVLICETGRLAGVIPCFRI